MPGPVKKQARRLVRGDYVRLGENVNIDRVLSIVPNEHEGDEALSLHLRLKPIDGSEPYETDVPATEYVKVGWSAAIGLPVLLMADDRGNITADVDWSEAGKALSEDQAAGAAGIIRLVESWLSHHEVLPVAFPKAANGEPAKRCPKCGSPVTVWYEPGFDDDVEPRSDCLVDGCYGSTA